VDFSTTVAEVEDEFTVICIGKAAAVFGKMRGVWKSSKKF